MNDMDENPGLRVKGRGMTRRRGKNAESVGSRERVTMRDDKQGQRVQDYSRSPVINLVWLLSSGY